MIKKRLSDLSSILVDKVIRVRNDIFCNPFIQKGPTKSAIPDDMQWRLYTANIFNVFFTVCKCVPISTVISLYGLHLIAAPSAVE